MKKVKSASRMVLMAGNVAFSNEDLRQAIRDGVDYALENDLSFNLESTGFDVVNNIPAVEFYFEHHGGMYEIPDISIEEDSPTVRGHKEPEVPDPDTMRAVEMPTPIEKDHLTCYELANSIVSYLPVGEGKYVPAEALIALGEFKLRIILDCVSNAIPSIIRRALVNLISKTSERLDPERIYSGSKEMDPTAMFVYYIVWNDSIEGYEFWSSIYHMMCSDRDLNSKTIWLNEFVANYEKKH